MSTPPGGDLTVVDDARVSHLACVCILANCVQRRSRQCSDRASLGSAGCGGLGDDYWSGAYYWYRWSGGPAARNHRRRCNGAFYFYFIKGSFVGLLLFSPIFVK
ncbi:unnamed protein product [Cuscuta epithymum]|uniref:Uncharacterized protein n=1 Tax=Cuscuta epithymum TaxID=186058 RepID=A0AAV0GN09_9ASTE|nr:unnamed protein product [Cuscuta epithymum]CAH9148531.1 unnamed protein product [Cuscuta epithymum]